MKNILIVFALFVAVATASIPVNAQTTGPIPLCEITRTLKIGSQGDDVRCLQRYLNWAGFVVATTGVGSPGNESMYYGVLTSRAVARWQEANAAQVLQPLGLTQGTGNWGSASFSRYVAIVKAFLGVA